MKKYLILNIFFFILFFSTNANEIYKINNYRVYSDTTIFSLKNDTIEQTIKIVFLKKQIFYEYQVINRVLEIKTLIHGFANIKSYENLEFIEDENDIAYTAISYEHKSNNCWINISIDRDTKTRISISTSLECLTNINKNTPLNSIGLLYRISNK